MQFTVLGIPASQGSKSATGVALLVFGFVALIAADRKRADNE